MAAATRTPSLTRFGVDVAVWNIGGSSPGGGTDYYKYLTDCSLGINTPVQEGRSVLDLDQWLAAGAGSVSLDMSKVVITTALPLMALALSATPQFKAQVRHAITGDMYATVDPGAFLITSCKLSAGDGVMSESMSAILQGALAQSTPAISTAPSARTDLSSTAYGIDLASLAVGGAAGTAYDLINFYDSFDIDVSIGTTEGHAVMDAWQWPVRTGRKVTINASRLVEAPLSAPATSLGFMERARARAVLGVVIGLGALSFTGNFICTSAKWTSGGAGAQKESITLENIGAISLA